MTKTLYGRIIPLPASCGVGTADSRSRKLREQEFHSQFTTDPTDPHGSKPTIEEIHNFRCVKIREIRGKDFST